MSQKHTPTGLKVALFLLFFLGFAFNVALFLDVHMWGYMFRDIPPSPRSEAAAPAGRDQIRRSVFLVHTQRCDGQGWTTGTAFMVAPGTIITCDHVIGEHTACNSEIRLIDSEGRELSAMLEGVSDTDDLALLRVNDAATPPLVLADSTRFESGDSPVRVFTVGYPLVGQASMPDKASVSGVGTLSQYRSSDGVFITSGLNINPGNSGGPVFIEDSLTVVGVAVGKLDADIGEGIGYVIPSKTIRRFFREKTGREL